MKEKELCKANDFARNQGNIDVSGFVKSQKEFTDAAHEAAENMRQFGEVVEEKNVMSK